mgnify:CR=1 FL=1
MTNSHSREQSVKDQLKAKRDQTGVSYNILVKKFFIDGLLSLLSDSAYATKFVWKGGFVLSAITGVEKRTTVDLDTMLKGVRVDIPTLTAIIQDVISHESENGCQYSLIDITPIQEEKAYQGLRVRLQGQLGQMRDKFHLDVATGEKIEPAAVKWQYKPLLGEDFIPLFIYRPERILAEKLQTVLERSIANTRMKDFYDICTVPKLVSINHDVLTDAFDIVMRERGSSDLLDYWQGTLDLIRGNQRMQRQWADYAKKHEFVGKLTFSDTLNSVQGLLESLTN